MTGPQHYREAERDLTIAGSLVTTETTGSDDLAFYYLQRAQVHATLAGAAATMVARSTDVEGLPDDWQEVLG
jgi:hypothetical protein